MIKAILLSRRIEFDKEGKIYTEAVQSDITQFEVDDNPSESLHQVTEENGTVERLADLGIVIEDINFKQFEREFSG